MLSLTCVNAARRLPSGPKVVRSTFTSKMITPRLKPSSSSIRSKTLLNAMQTCSSRHFHSTWQVQEQEKPEKPSFLGAGEFHRLNDKSQGRIDEFGNFQTAEGLAMPTQSSGGLTKRNNSDISELDIFEGEGAVITAYSESGFVINEEYTEGSILSFPKRFWSWKPKTIQEITMENLAPIWLHNPVPQLLILGTGPTLLRPPEEVLKFLLVRGIATEVCSTPNAVSTFNFLVQEERSVAGAFLPAGITESRSKK